MTITSNIHAGLAAWSNHTFIARERCSNAGAAYECTTPGTSTSAPTGTGADVDNGGTAHFRWLSAIDYTTIAAWASGIPATLTQPVIGQLWNDAVIQCALGTILFNIDSHVTTTTNTITLTCAPGESWTDQSRSTTPLAADSTKGVTIRGVASGGPTSVSYCWISDDNVIVDGIQFVDPYAGSLSQLMIVWNTNFRLQNCIFDGYSSTSSGAVLLGLNAGTLAYVIANSLFFDRAVTAVGRCVLSSDAATTAGKIDYCTLISSSTSGEAMQAACTTAAGLVVTGCAAFGQTNAFTASGSNADVTVNHSVMSGASLAFATNGTGNLFSKTAASQFISATTDFRLKAGADCIHAGIDDTTNIPLGDDCFGGIRPSGLWDAGCYQYGIASVPEVHGRVPQLQPFLVQ